MKIYRIVDDDIEVPTERLMAVLGCARGRAPRGRLKRQIESAVAEVREHADCRLLYRSYAMQAEPGRVRIAGGTTLRSARLSQALRPCTRLYAYLVTLGPRVDVLIRESMEARPDFGVVVDAAASVAAESLVDRMEQDISESLPPTQALSLPFSAGYCDWHVSEQKKVFSLLPEGASGVTLSDDAMMSPRKSISGVFGAGPVDAVTETECPCCTCPRVDCTHRRRPYSGRKHEGIASHRSIRPRANRAPKLSL